MVCENPYETNRFEIVFDEQFDGKDVVEIENYMFDEEDDICDDD
jgi:hypothetical protein